VFAVTGGKDENGDLLVLNLADDAVILYSKTATVRIVDR